MFDFDRLEQKKHASRGLACRSDTQCKGLLVQVVVGVVLFLSAACLGHGAGSFSSDTPSAGPSPHWGHDRPAQSSRAEE